MDISLENPAKLNETEPPSPHTPVVMQTKRSDLTKYGAGDCETAVGKIGERSKQSHVRGGPLPTVGN